MNTQANERREIERKKEFDQVLSITSLKNYLKASAYASGERTTLEKSLKGSTYYKYLYAHSNEAEDYICDLPRRILHDDARNIVLSGYKGCGKTTFVHYLVRKLYMRHLLLNFDSMVDYGSEIKSVVVLFAYDLIYNDFFDNQCGVINEFLNIYDADENNFDVLERTIDVDNRFQHFFRELNYLRRNSNDTSLRHQKKTYLNNKVKTGLGEFEISQLMLLIVMWDVAGRILYKRSERCLIIFDNIDTIYNTTRLPEFTEQIALFRNNADRLFERLSYKGEPLGDPTQNYICIFVMRETTKAEFMEHFDDQKVSLYVPLKTMSNLYSMESIVKRRKEYLEQLERDQGGLDEHCNELLARISLLEMLLDDNKVQDDIMGLFNHDFRTCFDVLSELNFNDHHFFQTCENLKKIKTQGNWGKHGFRCVLFRAVFNLLKDNGYIDYMKKSDFQITVEHTTYAANLDRFILLYLSNSQNIHASEEDRENEYVSLRDLFRDFTRFFDDGAIVNSIWDMYEMRRNAYWNHLITFDEMGDVTKAELERQIECFRDGANCKYGKLRITVGGRKYIETMLPHFEYFAARVYSSNKPSLFTLTPEELLNSNSVFSYIDDVRKEENACCTKLKAFYTNIFESVDGYKGEGFLSSKFAWRKLTKRYGLIRMFHCERIIHSQISYLDTFRKYVFYSLDSVVNKGGFDSDIDVTEAMQKQIRCNADGAIANNGIINQNGIVRYICKRREKESTGNKKTCTVACKKEEGRYSSTVTTEISLVEMVDALKTLMNYKLIKEIQKYINMFGVQKKRSEDAMYSSTTEFLVDCYNCCIDSIIKENYADYNTPVDRKTGEKITERQRKMQWSAEAPEYAAANSVWDEDDSFEGDAVEDDPFEKLFA